MSTEARASAVAAERPPKPAPTITTRGRACGKFAAAVMSSSDSKYARIRAGAYVQTDNYIASAAGEGYLVRGDWLVHVGGKRGAWRSQMISRGLPPSVLAWRKQ